MVATRRAGIGCTGNHAQIGSTAFGGPAERDRRACRRISAEWIPRQDERLEAADCVQPDDLVAILQTASQQSNGDRAGHRFRCVRDEFVYIFRIETSGSDIASSSSSKLSDSSRPLIRSLWIGQMTGRLKTCRGGWGRMTKDVRIFDPFNLGGVDRPTPGVPGAPVVAPAPQTGRDERDQDDHRTDSKPGLREPCREFQGHLRLQLAHGVAGAELILFIKAWTESEDKKDQDILVAAGNEQPRWPWSTTGDFVVRLAEASGGPTGMERRGHQNAM